MAPIPPTFIHTTMMDNNTPTAANLQHSLNNDLKLRIPHRVQINWLIHVNIRQIGSQVRLTAKARTTAKRIAVQFCCRCCHPQHPQNSISHNTTTLIFFQQIAETFQQFAESAFSSLCESTHSPHKVPLSEFQQFAESAFTCDCAEASMQCMDCKIFLSCTEF